MLAEAQDPQLCGDAEGGRPRCRQLPHLCQGGRTPNRSDAEALEHNGLTPKDDLKKAKKSDPDIDRKLRDYTCEHFYDIRTFGALR